MVGPPPIPYPQPMNACETKSPNIRTTFPTTKGPFGFTPERASGPSTLSAVCLDFHNKRAGTFRAR